jgi:hypothetical protein
MDNVEQLKQMDSQKLEQILRNLNKDFDDFANDLSLGKNPEFAPPFNDYLSGDEDVIDYCHSVFQKYLGKLESFDKNQLNSINYIMKRIIERNSGQQIKFDLFSEVKLVCDTIIDTLIYLFKGLPSEALGTLEKGFLNNDCHLLKILTQIRLERPIFYRVRKGKYTEPKNIFHVPFELRNKCDSYRYSILGYPSLYLAASIETGLKECHIESDTEYSCSVFKSERVLCFIDLSLPYLPNNKKLNFIDQYSLLISYPIIIACGLKVKNPDDPYKPEYAFPQVFFQLLRLHSKGIDGVSYTSTRYEKPDLTKYEQRNFVLFIKEADKRNGYDENLSNTFSLTAPIQFNDIESLEKKQQQIMSSTFQKIQNN